MYLPPTIFYGLALFVFVLALLPDKYRPAWIHRLTPWQALIGLVAVIIATAIVLTPEFLALGILGDSAFFDFLVLAISFQLRGMGSWVWRHAISGLARIWRFVNWRLAAPGTAFLFIFADVAALVQKVVRRISS